MRLYWGLVLACAFWLGAAAGGCSDRGSDAPTQLAAVELSRSYQQSRSRADAALKGQRIEVNGSVAEMQFSVVGDPVALALLLPGELSPGVRCLVGEDLGNSVWWELHDGRPVGVNGICQGLQGRDVVLENCSVRLLPEAQAQSQAETEKPSTPSHPD